MGWSATEKAMKITVEFELDVSEYNSHYIPKHGEDFAWKATTTGKMASLMRDILGESFYDFAQLKGDVENPLKVSVKLD